MELSAMMETFCVPVAQYTCGVEHFTVQTSVAEGVNF